MIKTKKLKWLLFSFAFFYVLSGCGWYTVNIPEKDMRWGGYQYRQKYMLKKDLFIVRPHPILMPLKIALVPETSYKGRQLGRFYLSPNSIKEYEKDKDAGAWYKNGDFEWKVSVIGVVKAGTILEASKIKNRKGWNFYYGRTNDLTPFARILTGPYAGKTVDITDISIYYRDSISGVFIFKPEDALIEKLSIQKIQGSQRAWTGTFSTFKHMNNDAAGTIFDEGNFNDNTKIHSPESPSP